MNTTPILNYLRRYWLLIVVFVAFALLALNDRVFALVGTFAYAPALVTLAALCALLLRNVFNRQTTDPFVDDGGYDAAFAALTARERFEHTFRQWAIYFIGACIIVAAIAH